MTFRLFITETFISNKILEFRKLNFRTGSTPCRNYEGGLQTVRESLAREALVLLPAVHLVTNQTSEMTLGGKNECYFSFSTLFETHATAFHNPQKKF